MADYLKAMAGDARMQLSIACRMTVSLELGDDPSKAIYWANRAARNGETAGYHQIAGILALTGGLTPEIQRRMFEAWQAQADAGDPEGQWSVAWCYRQGVGIDKNPELELKWLTTAAMNGHPDALKVIKERLESGPEP